MHPALAGRMQSLLGAAIVVFAVLLALPAAGASLLSVGPGGTHATLAAALAAARDGDTIEVWGGEHPGPVHIDKSVHLKGRDGPVIAGAGQGTVVTITAPHTVFEGFTVQGSGAVLHNHDAGIFVDGASGVVVRDNYLHDVLFGIYLAKAPHGRLTGNRIDAKDLPPGRRGDAMRIWYSDASHIEGNLVIGSRDVLIWYTDNAVVRHNRVEGGRYGLHLMNSEDLVIENNTLRDNSVGLYLMYTRRVRVAGNQMSDNRGPSGFGFGLKDADEVIIEDNWILHNRVGVYMDNSPRDLYAYNTFSRNAFVGNDTGILMLPSVTRNTFSRNSFIDNTVQVGLGGRGGRPEANAWSADGLGNYWSDYAGYDRSGNGIGEVPYRAESLFENLMDQHPTVRWFLHSPSAAAVDLAARAFPAFAPQARLVDDAPLMAPSLPEIPPVHPTTNDYTLAAALAALGVAAVVLSLAGGRVRRIKQ